MLCFSICLIGCAVPALATSVDYSSGEINSAVSAYTGDYAFWSKTSFGTPLATPFDSLPIAHLVTFPTDGTEWVLSSSAYTRSSSGYGCYLDGATFLMMFPLLPGEIEYTNGQTRPPQILSVDDLEAPSGYGLTAPTVVQWDFIVDNEVLDTYLSEGNSGILPEGTFSYSGTVNGHFALQATVIGDQSKSLGGYTTKPLIVGGWQYNTTVYTYNEVVVEDSDFQIMIGQLDGISQDVTVIKSATIQINDNVVEIKEELQDLTNQFEDPESNIWQAAGQAIKDSITSLFVPSQAEIEEVKQGFDDLAKDKLGGAYTAMETVDQTITQVNDKLNNPSAAEGVEFPGISVPLGGDVGTVTIAEPQMVTLPLQLTSILHPVAGTIISIVVGLGTFNTLKDMVECFLSGYSYSEFLHRSKVRDDE